MLTWAELFEGSSMEGKKMIVWQLIDKVRISRDYKIEIDLKVSLEQFKTLWHREDKKITVTGRLKKKKSGKPATTDFPEPWWSWTRRR